MCTSVYIVRLSIINQAKRVCPFEDTKISLDTLW